MWRSCKQLLWYLHFFTPKRCFVFSVLLVPSSGHYGSCHFIKSFPASTHSSTLAWKIPWTEEPGRLQSMGSLRVGDNWTTSLSLFTFMHWRRKWQPTPVFLAGESQGRGAWWAAVYGVAQDRTRLKRFSSSSSFQMVVTGLAGSKFRDWCWSWSSNTLATWCEEPTHWKRPWR